MYPSNSFEESITKIFHHKVIKAKKKKQSILEREKK